MGTLVWRRWVVRGAACTGGLVAAVVVATLVLLRSLDRPWIKSRLQGIARTAGGVEIDYRSAHIAWLSGAVIDGLVVQSPSELRRFAPDLLRVDRIEVEWSLGALLRRRGPFVRRAEVRGIALTVVADENGRTSFDALAPSPAPPKPPPAPSVPLSRQASKALGEALPIGELDVDDVALNLVRTEHGQELERSQVRGLSFALTTMSAEPAARGSRVQAGLGSPASPLDVQVTRAPATGEAKSAHAKLWLTVDATSTAVSAAFDLRMREQTFAAAVPEDHWLHAEAHVRFDPAAERTVVTLDRADAGDGAATIQATVEIPDEGDPLVRSANGVVDLARLLRWLPAGMVPCTAERARVSYRVESLAAGPILHLSEGGSVTVDAALTNVDFATATATAHIGSADLSLKAEPAAGTGVAGRASMKIDALMLDSSGDRIDARDLALEADGEQGAEGAITGRVGLRFAELVRAGAVPVIAKGGHVELRAKELHANTEEPLSSRGDLAVLVEMASIDARPTGTRVAVDGIVLHAHTALAGTAPYGADVDGAASRVRGVGAGGKVLIDAPVRIEAHAEGVQPDLAQPAASRAIVHAVVDVRDTQLSLDATKGVDSVGFTVRADMRSLKDARPFLPPAWIEQAPWDRMAVSLRSTGQVERLGAGSPAIRQTTTLQVAPAAFGKVAAQSVSFTFKSEGTALRHQADIDVRAQGLSIDGGSPSDDHATLSAHLDREHTSLGFEIATEGRAATKVSGSLAFDPARRALTYGIEGHLGGLAPVAPFAAQIDGLNAVDFSKLEIGFAAHGALLGVVTGVSRDGVLRLAPNPMQTAAIDGTADLDATHLHWAHGDTAVITPALKWHVDLHTTGARRTLESQFEIGTLHLDLGSHDVDLNGIRYVASVTAIGDLSDPETELTQKLSLRGVEQDFTPEYPMGDVDVSLSAERSREGMVHIAELKVANGAAGTALGVTGNVYLGGGRRTLSVITSLTQDLGRLSSIPERFKGSGNVTVEANVTSPDLAHCEVRAIVKGDDVSVTLPRAGIEVETANGQVPITVSLDVGKNGVELQRGQKRSPYSMLRFTDQHPLLTRSGFLSIVRLKTPFIAIAPLVGNLEIEQNVIALRQFEMGVRGGTITGQCGVVLDGAKSTVELHIRANGVQSSHGEPFDGNIEVAISAADRTVEGRAEILRIGERHLLDLLDLQDPLHVDSAMNRIRTALKFGYPDSLRLVFDHGFASAHLELGGLARLVSIGELRGIPMGPLVDRMLGPILDPSNTKDTP